MRFGIYDHRVYNSTIGPARTLSATKIIPRQAGILLNLSVQLVQTQILLILSKYICMTA